MARYAWLKREASRIPRKKFFLFEAISQKELQTVELRFGALPDDYKEFVREFGRAKMFLWTMSPTYLMEVTAPPEVLTGACNAKGSESVTFIQLGNYVNSGYVGLQWVNGSYLDNGAIFSSMDLFAAKTRFKSFESWLVWTFERSRREGYSKSEWDAIHRPIAPFSSQERKIIEAIGFFEFRKVGVSPDGNILVEVRNRGSVVLPYLSVGVKLGSSGLIGRCALPTADITPGTTCIVEHPIYKGSADPDDIELFRLPLPDPEDRPYFLEFGAPIR